MLLVGAGQLSQSLAELGLAMDFEVIVTDPRQRMLDQWDGPDVQLVGGMPACGRQAPCRFEIVTFDRTVS